MARDKLCYERDDFDEDEAYFTYRPLSNLPTPPPSSRNSSANQSPKTTLDDGEPLVEKFLGKITHMLFSGVGALEPTNGAILSSSCVLILVRFDFFF
jgi:hypothetical protein